MSVTVNNVVQDALGVLGEVTGVGVQTYSEPRMIKDAGRAFNLLFKKRFWEQYTKWVTVILDGVNGIITTDAFTQVLDFEDFAAVHPAGKNYPLYTLPPGMNPNVVTGTTPRYFTSLEQSHANYAARKLKIYPVAATGSLDVRARYHPLTAGNEWAGATVLHFDRDLLVLGTAYMALSGDDLNAGAKADVQEMLDTRYRDVMDALGGQATSMNNNRARIPSEWFVPPP